MKKVSDKYRKELAKYYRQRRAYITKNWLCMVEGCCYTSVDVHHKRGRGKYLLDESTWLPVCRGCHNKIETHPNWAKENGYSESRLYEV